MKYFYKLLIITILLSINLQAQTLLINEPILESKVHLKLYGNKNNPPMVFVHGLGNEASTVWEKSISKLKDRFYIMSFDLPGFGKSSKDKKEYTPKNYALILDYLTTKYLDKPFDLIGHSLGGAISLKFVSLFPSKVNKLVLIDVAGILHKEAYSKFIIAMKLDKNSQTNDSKLGTFFSKVISITEKILPVDLETIVDTPLRNMISAPTIAAISLASENFSNIPESITQKTLIIWGEKDDIAPLRTGYVLDKLIPNSQLKIIKNASHVPIVNNFDEYYKYLNSFLMDKQEIDVVKNIPIKKYDSIFINNEKNMVLSGLFKKVLIKKSKNILLKNCIIEELIIYDSDVHLLNSRVKNKNFAIKTEYSTLLITTSTIQATQPILSQSSRLDIAGSHLLGERNVIYNINNRNNTHVIFSLSEISIQGKNNKIMHGKTVLVSADKI